MALNREWDLAHSSNTSRANGFYTAVHSVDLLSQTDFFTLIQNLLLHKINIPIEEYCLLN